jgi:hypothetical protein
MEAEKGLQKCSAASYYQQQLPLFFTFCDVNHQCQALSELSAEKLKKQTRIKIEQQKKSANALHS